MKIYGLTGSIGSGKSTVAQEFENQGIPVICADKLAHDVVRPGQPSLQRIKEVFGEEFLLANGELDRTKLGSLVFANPQERKKLNEILHPAIRGLMMQIIQEYRDKNQVLILLDIPLLYESGWESLCDGVIVAYSPESLMKERIRQRDNLSDEEIENRIRSQISIEEKKQRADYVIDNSKEKSQTKKQTLELIKKIS